MQDISASGISLLVKGSVTFPNGFTVTQFADDADPFDLPALEIAATAMNLNGELVTWSAPQPINPSLNVIPGSEDDNNLSALFEANRAAQGRTIGQAQACWPVERCITEQFNAAPQFPKAAARLRRARGCCTAQRAWPPWCAC